MEPGLKDSKIALTGATGFLGSHLVPMLAEQDARITCLSRSATSAMPKNVSIIRGDCLDREVMTRLIRGQDIFIHMAALLFGVSWQDYFRANLRAARIIVDVMNSLPEEERPSRTVFISSLAAAGPCAILPGKRESEEPAPVSAYGWSKLCCEQTLAAAEPGNLIILRPPIIYGSGDTGLLPLFKSAARGIGVSPGAFRNFPVSVIHARDAARAIIAACAMDEIGVYHLNDGFSHTMDEFCRKAAIACGRHKCVVLHAPLPFMGVTAMLSSAIGNIGARISSGKKGASGKPPHWNVDKYREARQSGWLADGEKFRNASGFVPCIRLEEGLQETVEGYRSRGWL